MFNNFTELQHSLHSSVISHQHIEVVRSKKIYRKVTIEWEILEYCTVDEFRLTGAE